MTSQLIQEQIIAYIDQNLDSESHFLLEVNIGSGKVKDGKVQILIDSDSGITIAECAIYSRKIGSFLEESDLFENPYTLEVASPGLDFPLKTERQFLKNLNRNLLVETRDNGILTEGKLLSFESGCLKLEVKEKLKGKKATTKTVEIPFENIVNAKVTVSFK